MPSSPHPHYDEEWLERLVVAATSRPADVLTQIEAARDEVTASDARLLWLVELAHALALRSGLRLDAADVVFRRAASLAGATGEARKLARVEMSWAGNSMFAGRLPEATALLQRASAGADGTLAAQVSHQLAGVAAMSGRYEDAIREQGVALRKFRAAGDMLWTARALQNRSKMAAFAGDVRRGIADARMSASVFRSIDHAAGEAKSLHNLAGLLATSGDFNAALRAFEETESRLAVLGVAPEQGAESRIDALHRGGLFEDAFRIAVEATRAYGRAGADLMGAQCALGAARAAMRLGDLAAARTYADEAERSFAGQARQGWLLQARLVRLHASEASQRAELHGLIESLDELGWRDLANEARVLAVATARAVGDREQSRPHLQMLALAPRHASLTRRLSARSAAAELALLDGDAVRARALAGRGFAVAHKNRILLASTESRSLSGRAEDQLARVAQRAALAEDRLDLVWQWGERGRIQPMTHGFSVPEDPGSRRALVALRAIDTQIEDDRAENRSGSPLLVDERRRLERILTGNSGPGRGGTRIAPPTLRAVRSQLGERAMIWFFDLDGVLYNLSITSTTLNVQTLGPTHEIESSIDRLRAALLRALIEPSSRAYRRAVERAANVESFLGFELPGSADAEVVLVPASPLRGLSWGVLPGLTDRPFCVAQSSTQWSRSRCGPTDNCRVTAVAGPHLPHAEAEVRAVLRAYARTAGATAQCLRGRRARPSSVLRVLGETDVAHLAMHTRLRSHNPDFSALVLAGGSLLIRDLSGLAHIPQCVVLSACGAGDAPSVKGPEVHGLAERLNALGSSTVIAPTMPVPDHLSPAAMAHLHGQLASGMRPSLALREVRRQSARSDAASSLTASSFVCFGRGS